MPRVMSADDAKQVAHVLTALGVIKIPQTQHKTWGKVAISVVMFVSFVNFASEMKLVVLMNEESITLRVFLVVSIFLVLFVSCVVFSDQKFLHVGSVWRQIRLWNRLFEFKTLKIPAARSTKPQRGKRFTKRTWFSAREYTLASQPTFWLRNKFHWVF